MPAILIKILADLMALGAFVAMVGLWAGVACGV